MAPLLPNEVFKTLTLDYCLYLAKQLAEFELNDDAAGFICKYGLTSDQIKVVRYIGISITSTN